MRRLIVDNARAHVVTWFRSNHLVRRHSACCGRRVVLGRLAPAVLCAVLAIGERNACADSYNFTRIASDADFTLSTPGANYITNSILNYNYPYRYAINNSGEVAFTINAPTLSDAAVVYQNRLYRWSGGDLTLELHDNPTSGNYLLPDSIDMNDGGIISYSTLTTFVGGWHQGIHTTAGQTIDEITYSADSPTMFGNFTAINNSNQVAYTVGTTSSYVHSIQRGDGFSNPTTIASIVDNGYSLIDSPLSINNQGQVAFLANTGEPGQYHGGAYLGDGGPIQTVVPRQSGVLWAGAPAPGINDAGEVAVQRIVYGGSSQWIELRDSTTPTSELVQTYGGYGTSINALGQVAYRNASEMLLNGERILGVGDALDGSTVNLIFTPEVNDRGQLVFPAVLANGRAGLYLASPANLKPIPSFRGLGDLPGGTIESLATDVSADGSVVVGQSQSSSGIEAFRWTRGEGMQGLGDLPGGTFSSSARGVSQDGNIIVGYSEVGALTQEAFRGTAHGLTSLGDLPGAISFSQAYDTSADGTVVVGWGAVAAGAEAFRWTADEGMVGLGHLPGPATDSEAYGVSGDGTVIVGYGISANGAEAFRWTAVGGMVGLGDLPGGGFHSRAQRVSTDGAVVVGSGESADGIEAFRWTADSGMVGLGRLPGASQSIANDTTADGKIIVGSSGSGSDSLAFYWSQETGLVNLKTMLLAQGVSHLSAWTLSSATAISPDGRTIVGWGVNPNGQTEAWQVTLVPEPSTIALGLLGVVIVLGNAARRSRSMAS